MRDVHEYYYANFVRSRIGRHSKIIPFPVDRPGDINLRTYPAAFFFLYFRQFLSDFQTVFHPYTRNDKGIITEKKDFEKKKVFRPAGWSYIFPPGRQETDLFFSVA